MNNSEEDFRRQCEARKVLTMDHERRQAYYQGVLEKRKQKGVDELIAEVKRQRRLLSQQAEI